MHVEYLDFQKEIDNVPRLIHKIKTHGIGSNILACIEDFLMDRKHIWKKWAILGLAYCNCSSAAKISTWRPSYLQSLIVTSRRKLSVIMHSSWLTTFPKLGGKIAVSRMTRDYTDWAVQEALFQKLRQGDLYTVFVVRLLCRSLFATDNMADVAKRLQFLKNSAFQLKEACPAEARYLLWIHQSVTGMKVKPEGVCSHCFQCFLPGNHRVRLKSKRRMTRQIKKLLQREAANWKFNLKQVRQLQKYRNSRSTLNICLYAFHIIAFIEIR
ncbi:UPF0711 protein C18orf21 homolog isoform X4 [Scyliorhinus canicula]|uniref:UPF0711 protein C18orf21 homolog isoform X4 n=1 Tax=Scyliorhinus canicula TaxID=7830 RepID=UPI0018F5F8C5|nr:UPF0711 protein C18orf21 homolog isoform X4 [Scyliorhinus canicula]